jgi:fructuronate reductase
VTRLSRSTWSAGPPRPVRAVHLGAGAFFRAHPAWYTEQAGDGWGIAAVAPRSQRAVDDLGPQDGLYTLVTREPVGDAAEVVGTVTEVLAGAGTEWLDRVADPDVAVVTLTITEAGYRAGSPTIAGLVEGLDRRLRAGGAALAVVSCDNVDSNGALLRDRVIAAAADAGLRRFVTAACAFPATVVDRITPATGPGDLALVARLLGREDHAAVVTEGFHEWVLQDRFPLGRPAWEAAGAVFVDDVTPYAARKLLLLNAGHTLLATVGARRGHRFVHEAVADPVVLDVLRGLWDEAVATMDAGTAAGTAAYREQTERRWHNARLPHALAQIGTDTSLKLRQRLAPTVATARDAGTGSGAATLVLAAWVLQRRGPRPPPDAGAAGLAGLGSVPMVEAVGAALRAVDVRLATPDTVAAVTDAARRLEADQVGPGPSR